VDQAARDRIRNDLDATLLVEAAAGTGKTTELVNRIVAVLAAGRGTVDSMVAVTFTEKAAGELKLRMRQRLELARQDTSHDGEARRHLEDSLARLEEARVGTIHGFCADLLRERSVEAEVDPQFETLNEAESERLYREAFHTWMQEQLEHPSEGIRRTLRRSSWAARRRFGRRSKQATIGQTSGVDNGPMERLRSAGWTLAEWRDFPTPWQRPEFDRELRIDALVQQLHAFADISSRCARPKHDALYQNTEPARLLSGRIATAEAVRPRDHDGVEADLVDLCDAARDFTRLKGRGRYADSVTREEVLASAEALREALQDFKRDADADLAALLHGELANATQRYERLKLRTGRLDFVDLLLRARDLLRDNERVRRDFQERFSHIFVDEFQDTDPLQAEILLLLAAEEAQLQDWRQSSPTPGKLFLVGDPKQSIYRFRRADIGMYLEVKKLLVATGAHAVYLSSSFRNVSAIQHAVNAAFARFMDGDETSLQAEYVPLSPVRDTPTDQPSLVALPVPSPYGVRGITKYAIDQSLPDAVGAFVDWLLQHSGWTVTERENPHLRVPISARHVCLLFRRFTSFGTDVTSAYANALEARGIHHLLVGGRSFHDREEVETLRTALVAIEWPDDELSLFATLRGSLFAIGDEELLEYRKSIGRLHPLRRARTEVPEHLQAIPEALALLGGLHRERNRRPIAETVNLLLESTRAHAGFVFRPSGDQVLANVLHLAEMARTYERRGGISLRGFIEQLLDEVVTHRTAEAPILEEGSDGVRIMTVHRAKGLEFPVVILVDPTANLTNRIANRWIDARNHLCAQRISGLTPHDLLDHDEPERRRDAAEGVRLAYVAATRARDLLVIPTVGDEIFAGGGHAGLPPDERPPLTGWLSPLNAAVYPPRGEWRHAEPLAGGEDFGHDSVVQRPVNIAMAAESVQPGMHTFRKGETDSYQVAWWDPHCLELNKEPHFGLRQEELLAPAEQDDVAGSAAREHRRWQEKRTAQIEEAAWPSLVWQTATSFAATLLDKSNAGATLAAIEKEWVQKAEKVELVELQVPPGRPRGARFGSLVHAVLATISLDADADAVAAMCRLQGRVLGCTEPEVHAAGDTVLRALQHPLMREAHGAQQDGRCRRECPIALRAEDHEIVEGIVDLAFETDSGWTVIDYKTDQELAEGLLDVYRFQVTLYAQAIARATSSPTRAILLRI
jgi:ATP-dependent exoDNAse (exonuclease V) beta subunit